MLWMRMARSESPDTRLLHSLVCRRLALLSIYSAQRLRDREQSTYRHTYIAYAWLYQVAHLTGSRCFWLWFYWFSFIFWLISIRALAMALLVSMLFSLNISAYLMGFFISPDLCTFLDDVFLGVVCFAAVSALEGFMAIFVVHLDCHHARSGS